MKKDQLVINIKQEFVIRGLVDRLRQDIAQLAIAHVRKNEHDIGQHLHAATERIQALHERVFESAFVGMESRQQEGDR